MARHQLYPEFLTAQPRCLSSENAAKLPGEVAMIDYFLVKQGALPPKEARPKEPDEHTQLFNALKKFQDELAKRPENSAYRSSGVFDPATWSALNDNERNQLSELEVYRRRANGCGLWD